MPAVDMWLLAGLKRGLADARGSMAWRVIGVRGTSKEPEWTRAFLAEEGASQSSSAMSWIERSFQKPGQNEIPPARASS